MQQLPQNALVLVLGHISQEERMTSCAVVSQAWSEAASLATGHMHLKYTEVDLDPADYMPYLEKHGQHVTALSCLDNWEDDRKYILEGLPCPNLRELDLEDCAMQLGPFEGEYELQAAEPGLLQGLTALTKLVLTMQQIDDFVHPAAEGLACLTALTALPALQHFDLSVGEAFGASDGTYDLHDAPNEAMPGGVFVGLTNLTNLKLKSGFTVDSLEHLSCLSKLQHLVLDLRCPIPDSGTAAASAQQPFKQLQQLTYLALDIPEYQLISSSSSSPAFAGCTALQVLELTRCCADASVLQGLTGLQYLVFAASQVLTGGGVGYTAALGHISCMQALTRLELSQERRGIMFFNDRGLGALSASPQLRSLWLLDVDLPMCGWSYLFSRGRVLTGLTTLHMHRVRPGTIMDSLYLRMLVDCCPALQQLKVDVPHGFEPGVSLLPLLQLKDLVDLEWDDDVTGSVESVGVLSRLTQLTRLSICAGKYVTVPHVLRLTALRQLRCLSVQGMPELKSRAGSGDTFESPKGGQPNVWYQLLLGCAATAECQAAVNQQLPDIKQQLQDSGYGVTVFGLAQEEGQARAGVAQATAELALAQAKLALAQASQKQAESRLLEQLQL